MTRALLVMMWVAAMAHSPAFAGADTAGQPLSGEALLRGPLARPAARLAGAKVLRGRFTQRRHLSELPRPLTASGEFLFARELGVYWHTRKPFDSVVTLSPSGIVERAEGSETMRLSADDQPAVRMVAQVFLALFTLDMDSLERHFRVYPESGDGNSGPWSIRLEPRGDAIANVFVHANISGHDDVEQVVLTDARGDRTVIDLAAVEYSDTPPPAAIRALFESAAP